METDPIVDTRYGSIQGFALRAERGSEAEVFLGIPFAKPPVGELRFEKPQPPVPWDGILDTKTKKPGCITYPTMFNPRGKEDCLYLNLIRPKTASKNPDGYPVMVFIHGGAFLFGSAGDADYEKAADRVVSQGVIFIAIQYRLGVLGFYTTDDDVISGNYGIWDQIQALKFIQEVVRDFGGDPDNVTIFGESAGGACTSLLTVTREAEGLFRRSIMMSGSAKALWVVSRNGLKSSNKVEEVLGLSGPSQEKKKKLKTLAAKELVDATKTFIKDLSPGDTMKLNYFNPTFDGKLIRKEVLNDFEGYSKELKKKEALIGLCSQESILFAVAFPGTVPDTKYYPLALEKAANLNEDEFIETVKHLFSEDNAYGDRFPEAVEKIIEFYLNQRLNYTHNEYFQAFVQLISDVSFNIPAMREAVQKHKAGHQVYCFIYDFPQVDNPLVDGASHCCDIIALFGAWIPQLDKPLEGEYERVVDGFAEVFTSFARNGVPTCRELTASKVTEESIPFINIGKVAELKANLWPERLKFWDDLASEFGYDWPSDRWIGKDSKI